MTDLFQVLKSLNGNTVSAEDFAWAEIQKMNTNHDARGQFASGHNGGTHGLSAVAPEKHSAEHKAARSGVNEGLAKLGMHARKHNGVSGSGERVMSNVMPSAHARTLSDKVHDHLKALGFERKGTGTYVKGKHGVTMGVHTMTSTRGSVVHVQHHELL